MLTYTNTEHIHLVYSVDLQLERILVLTKEY